MTLLLAWVPASSHCLLAAAIENVILSDCCLDSKQTQNTDPHENSDCCPFCDTFESGKFLTSSKDNLGFDAGPVVLLPLVGEVQLVLESNPASSSIPRASPPGRTSWQFETRSAGMGRSPNASV
ncbi:MAG TPA: hypothetical protein QGH16_10055 [Verrucomicrobiota bacterium]|jgi:hypothetical protein|nr:hypothetical protein [Verrucomicrobiota bacterium]